jgi:hypothetical protein
MLSREAIGRIHEGISQVCQRVTRLDFVHDFAHPELSISERNNTESGAW